MMSYQKKKSARAMRRQATMDKVKNWAVWDEQAQRYVMEKS